MPKLRTPVRYGSELKDIEFRNFLNLDESVKQIIDCPVGVFTPVKDRAIASGKFLQSDNRGSLLINSRRNSKHVETIAIRLTTGSPTRLFAFAQRVNGCLAVIVDSFNLNMTLWVDSTTTIVFRVLGTTGVYWLPFGGHNLYLQADLGVGGYVDFTVYGFY